MSDVKLKILPPWSTYVHKLEALFDGDPQIAFNVNYSGRNPEVVLSTNNPEKAAALAKLLPDEVIFGNVVLNVVVEAPTYSNNAFADPRELFETAFSGNPAFAYVVTTDGYWYVPFCFVVFKNCVVQFFNDKLNDPHGVLSTLYQDIAAEVFKDANLPGGVSYCTDVERKLGMTVNEWLGDAVAN